MANMINLTIDGIQTQIEAGSTILQAAEQVGVHIPTLCYLDLHEIGIENKPASCRVCVVEVAGRRNLAPACATPVTEGMVVRTNTPKVMDARKTVVELMLSDHPKDCLTCPKSGQCELQTLAETMGIRKVRVTGQSQSTYTLDCSSPSIVRDADKCIMCRRCETMCNEVQTVGALSAVNRGFDAVVSTAFESPLGETKCTFCGQCIQVCPVGALHEKSNIDEVIEALGDPDKTVIVNTAPAVRAALGEEFGIDPGYSVTGEMVAALRRIGFDYVFDTDFTADLTIMEEATELVDRLQKFLKGEPVAMPMITSCCPAWINFIETQFPELQDLPSSAKSPMEMFGAIAKSYFAQSKGIDPRDLVVVSIMPCTAKKFEAKRDEMNTNGTANKDIDISLTTRELAELIRQMNIDLLDLEEIQNRWMHEEGVNVHLTIDRPQEGWDGHVGFVPNYVKELGFDPQGKVLVCGPPIMIKFTTQGLMEMGFDKTQIYTTMELRMKCGVGKCGRCNIGSKYVCKDGPVFRFDELGELPAEY